jgi:hypothetical protein
VRHVARMGKIILEWMLMITGCENLDVSGCDRVVCSSELAKKMYMFHKRRISLPPELLSASPEELDFTSIKPMQLTRDR